MHVAYDIFLIPTITTMLLLGLRFVFKHENYDSNKSGSTTQSIKIIKNPLK